MIGSDCHLDQLIADIQDELRARPYELAAVAGGYQFRTRRGYGDVVRAAGRGAAADRRDLSPLERMVLTAIAYFQPVTRMQIADILGKPVSRDVDRRAAPRRSGRRRPAQPAAGRALTPM